MADLRMLSDEIIRVQGELKSLRPGSEEYKACLDELKMLQSIENDESRIAIDESKVDNDRMKIQCDDLKSHRDERREYVKIGASILGGASLITLTQVLESEKLIRSSKAWQFATGIVRRVLG